MPAVALINEPMRQCVPAKIDILPDEFDADYDDEFCMEIPELAVNPSVPAKPSLPNQIKHEAVVPQLSPIVATFHPTVHIIYSIK